MAQPTRDLTELEAYASQVQLDNYHLNETLIQLKTDNEVLRTDNQNLHTDNNNLNNHIEALHNNVIALQEQLKQVLVRVGEAPEPKLKKKKTQKAVAPTETLPKVTVPTKNSFSVLMDTGETAHHSQTDTNCDKNESLAPSTSPNENQTDRRQNSPAPTAILPPKLANPAPKSQPLRQSQQSNATNSNTIMTNNRAPPKPDKIAPIIIRDGKWTEISIIIKNNNIQYTKAKMVSSGVQVEPTTEDDYRKLNTLLRNQKIQYYTYQLQSEKPLKVVIRGVIHQITETEVQDDLDRQGFPALKVSRMQCLTGPAPLMLVEIAREYKAIYDLTTCCNLSITVEPVHVRTDIVQCHRCQLFGHVQRNCNSNYKCMKCGGDHSTHLCEKPRTTSPQCANCGEDHLSISLRCERNPNNKPSRQQNRTMPPINPWKRTEPPLTLEFPELPPKLNAQQNSSTQQLSTLIGDLFLTIAQTNATPSQQQHFFVKTQELISLFKQNRNA